jgi:hypothetical protein
MSCVMCSSDPMHMAIRTTEKERILFLIVLNLRICSPSDVLFVACARIGSIVSLPPTPQDPVRFPVSSMNSFVNTLHANGQHYVVIVDPGISNTPGYAPYDTGLQQNLFIKKGDGSVFIGKVWPGTTAFPDFLHPNATQYWTANIQAFLATVPIDGLWIDMNEISNFCDGDCNGASTASPVANPFYGPNFSPNAPPYVINNCGSMVCACVRLSLSLSLSLSLLHFAHFASCTRVSLAYSQECMSLLIVS